MPLDRGYLLPDGIRQASIHLARKANWHGAIRHARHDQHFGRYASKRFAHVAPIRNGDVMSSRGCIARKHAIGIPNLRPSLAKCDLCFVEILVLDQSIEVLLAEKPGEIDHSGALDPLDWVLGIGATFICRIKCDYGRDGVDYGVNLSVAASGRNPEYETFHKARIRNTPLDALERAQGRSGNRIKACKSESLGYELVLDAHHVANIIFWECGAEPVLG